MRDGEWQLKKFNYQRDSETGRRIATPYWDEYTESTELDGLWIKVYLGDRQISDWKSAGKMIKDASWSDASVNGAMPTSTAN